MQESTRADIRGLSQDQQQLFIDTIADGIQPTYNSSVLILLRK